MNRRRWGWRQRPVAVLVAAGLLTATACSTTVPGSASERPYQPLDPQQIAISEIELPSSLFGTDGSLSTAVVYLDDGPCVVPLDHAEPVTDQAVCVTGVDPDWLGAAYFAPDGKHVALFPDGRSASPQEVSSWVVDTATGEAVPLGADPDDPQRPALLMGGAWHSNTGLVTVGLDRIDSVDIGTGAVTTLAELAEGEWADTLLIGGDTAVVRVGTEALPIDLDAGEPGTRIPLVQSGQPQLFGVSPDGNTLLATATDLTYYRPGPLELIDVHDGSRTAIEFEDERYFVGGGFSPDGSQAIIFSYSAEARDSSETDVHLITIADGTVTDVGSVATSMYGPVVWDRQNLLTTPDLRYYPNSNALRLTD